MTMSEILSTENISLTTVTGTEQIMAARLSDGIIFYITLSDITAGFVSASSLSTTLSSYVTTTGLTTTLTNYVKSTALNVVLDNYVAKSENVNYSDVSVALAPFKPVQTIPAVNLFFINAAEIGTMGAQGQNLADTAKTRSGYMQVVPGTSYKILDTDKAVLSDTSSTNVYYYTSAKVFITGSVNAVTAPDTAAFARLTNSRLPTLNTKLMFVSSVAVVDSFVPGGYTFDTESILYPLVLPKKTLSPALRSSSDDVVYALQQKAGGVLPKNVSFLTPSVNLYNPASADIVKQAYINTLGNYIATGSPTQQVAKIRVTPGKVYSFYNTVSLTQVTPPLNFLNFTGTNVSFPTSSYNADKTATAPASAEFMRVLLAIDVVYYTVVEGAAPPASFVDYGSTFTNEVAGISASDKYPWLNKNAGFLGDSITVQFLYGPAFLQTTRLTEAYREGINGGSLAYMGKNLTAAILAPLDVIFVLGGTNNYGVAGGGTVGTINSPMDDSTVHGQIKGLVNRIKTLKPNIRVVFFTCFNRTLYSGTPNAGNGYTPNADGLTIKIIAEAMIDECRYLGEPCFDMLSASGISSYNIGTSTVDGLHPNGYMATILGKKMGMFANTIIPF